MTAFRGKQLSLLVGAQMAPLGELSPQLSPQQELLRFQTTYVRNPKFSILPQTTLSPHSNLHHQNNPEDLQSLHFFSLECPVLTAPRVYGPSHNYVEKDKTQVVKYGSEKSYKSLCFKRFQLVNNSITVVSANTLCSI